MRHLAIYKVRGQCHKFTGTIRDDEADITPSALEGTIQVDSVDTEQAKRECLGTPHGDSHCSLTVRPLSL